MKILFVVCGEGLGHASRSLHLGHYMQQEGHTIHFAGYGKSYDFMQQHGCSNLHQIHREVCLEGVGGFFDLKKTLWCSRTIPLDLLKSAAGVSRLLKRHKFDCIVCDTMYGGIFSGWIRRVPVVFITNQTHFNGHNDKSNAVWMVLNLLIRRYLRLASHIIIPDYPPPDTVSEYNIRVSRNEKRRTTFTGPFYDFDPSRYDYGQKTIFTSFGGEPYKLPMYNLLKTIADQHKEEFFDVFYTGPVLPESSDNYASHGYVPNLYEHLAQAKIAIVHGGLTTLHEALLFEKPVLIILDPNHPEQQNNARKIVDIGAGIAIDGRTVTREILEQKIAETMTITPKPFRSAHVEFNGRKTAAAIISELCNKRQANVRGR
ncbi:glycosyltransferase [uncultured Methanoregula sp.]|uniref:glycosyltransferase n=1 Tax=uncultured Methanoregula sp. TaxID=1005933 RepID=UPI002AAA903F|nr:glycosyltransferase [uncultured Methanoregula sp.]